LSSGVALPRAVGDDYVLGPGDQVSVVVYTRQPRTYDASVTPTGHVLLDWLAPIPVAGSTLKDARERITRELRGLYKNVDVAVTLTQMRVFRVWLWGEVRQPGVYVVDPLMTVSDVIALSDALQDSSSRRRVLLRRAGVDVPVDLERVLIAGDTAGDVRLEPGDEIYVPVRGAAVTVDGQVKRPGKYEIDPAESVADVIARAGGATPDAALQYAYIERVQPQEAHIALDLRADGAGDARTPLADGDRVVVPSVSEFLGTVTLVGEFTALARNESAAPAAAGNPAPRASPPAPATDQQPGAETPPQGPVAPPVVPSLKLAVRPGLTLADAVNQAGGFTARAALEHATLMRAEAGGLISVPVDFAALQRGDMSQNLALRDGDVITAPSIRLYQGEVRISGEVRRLVGMPTGEPEVSAPEGWAIERLPETEPVLRVTLRGGMRLSELISIAGGATAEASLEHATLERTTPSGATRLVNVDFVALLQGGDASQDIALQDGDHVHIPSRETFVGRVTVSGEVYEAIKLPEAAFQTTLREGMRVRDLLELAGGPTSEADLDYSFLLTHDATGKALKRPVDLRAAWHGGDPEANVLLADGDRLYVPSIALRQDTIRIVGSFVGGDLLAGVGATEPTPALGEEGSTPATAETTGVRAGARLYGTPGGDQVGILAIGKGETVSDVIRRLGGVSPTADRRLARVERKAPDGTTQVFPVDLYELMVQANPAADLELQNGDTLVVPQLPNMVFVLDQVRKPGAYPYRAGLTVGQVIGLAGGLGDHAKPSSAVLLRVDEKGRTQPVPLNLRDILAGRSDVEVHPGDALLVPRQTIKTVQDVASIVQSLAGMFFLFQRF
jgi:protein involved in polysaccharide export with SLBB domain